MIPSGCSPPILTLFAGRAGAADYDSETGCLKEINELGKHHNSLLKDALRKLRAKHPHAAEIAYARGLLQSRPRVPHDAGALRGDRESTRVP